MRGVLLTQAPGAVLADITHTITPGDVRAAAYVLGRAWHRFPLGTVHLVVVDPGVGTSRTALAFHARGHFFVGPDNGVFTSVYHDTPVEMVTLSVPSDASPTFQGRDLFAPAAAALASGRPLAALGPAFAGIPERLVLPEPRYEGKTLVGQVIYVDWFGTLVTNLVAEQVPSHASVMIEDLDLGTLHRTFGDVPVGALVAYGGSGGLVEVAVRDGSAERRLGMGVGGRVRVVLG